jgi:hypothetical protein
MASEAAEDSRQSGARDQRPMGRFPLLFALAAGTLMACSALAQQPVQPLPKGDGARLATTPPAVTTCPAPAVKPLAPSRRQAKAAPWASIPPATTAWVVLATNARRSSKSAPPARWVGSDRGATASRATDGLVGVDLNSGSRSDSKDREQLIPGRERIPRRMRASGIDLR